jgi:hypothetical protein
MTFFGIYDWEKVCCNCRHFVKHYHYDSYSKKFQPLCCGHCYYPRVKHREPNQSCANFESVKGIPVKIDA